MDDDRHLVTTLVLFSFVYTNMVLCVVFGVYSKVTSFAVFPAITSAFTNNPLRTLLARVCSTFINGVFSIHGLYIVCVFFL